MHRFKITERGKNAYWLRGAERDHLVKVLRLSPGEKIIGFDNSGIELLGEIVKIEDKSVTCRVLGEDYPEVEAMTKVYLAAGLSKGEKMEWVIQKGTELGMAGLVPLRTKRSVMRLEGKKAEERIARWQKISGEAAKQSRRVIEPDIEMVSDWEELLGKLPEGTQWIIPYEEEKAQHLTEVLKQLTPNFPVAILVGPEGGFEASEVAWAKEKLSAYAVTLGQRILRAETAALAALTITLAHWGDLG